ncbi:glycosyltransferase family 4 protein [Arthrobacter sp. NPDC093128]|uniref:glycosyltransferase family 4 protein n=1 Tax=Arthrobacter sp. NPDC093128 TaxID=3154979 RepID=UPI0034186AF9
MNDPDFMSIRIRPELRAAQVKRASGMVPALTLYFDEKYDLGKTPVPDTFRKVTIFQCLQVIARSNSQILEVPEPLWLRFAPKNFLILAIWKLSGLFRFRRRTAVTYAIENNDFKSLLSPQTRVHPMIERTLRIVAGAAISLVIDRIAFGSSASMKLYHSLAGLDRVEQRLIEELPARSSDIRERVYGKKAIFVGELDDRKGILNLMAAWPAVEASVPGALLNVVGNGGHSKAVEAWCRERPESRVFCGLLAHDETAARISEADVLIAPSRRFGRWREQIGLPIVEALSMGLTVVTTDETGLATWLLEQGHSVIPEANVEQQLAVAIIQAVESPLNREEVRQSLPLIPGRISADSWLHTGYLQETPEDMK